MLGGLDWVPAGTFLITAVAVADIFEEPQLNVPLVTQSLLGWPVQIMGVEGEWFHLQADDGSPGWSLVSNFNLPLFPDLTRVRVQAKKTIVFLKPGSTPPLNVFLGSELVLLGQKNDWCEVGLPAGQTGWVAGADILGQALGVIATARLLTGTPYLWGGMTMLGLDCSGLTYLTYLLNGMQLPRDTADQFKAGKPVKTADLMPGDLVFFSTIVPGPSHVGIYLGQGEFINARTKEGVTVTGLDDKFFGPRFLEGRRYG